MGAPNRAFLCLLAGVAAALVPQMVAAHEKWFVPDANGYAVEWSRLLSWQVGLAVAVAAVAVVAARLAERWLQARRSRRPAAAAALAGIGEERLRRVYAYLPLLLAVHTAVPLLVNGFGLGLFAPNLHMRTNLLSGLLALAEVMIALALLYGVFTDYAALGLIGLFVAALALGPLVGIPAVFVPEQLLFVGIAVFLLIIGRGPFSGDALLGRRTRPRPQYIGLALPALRWGTGLSFAYLAFTEKLLTPRLAEAFLTQEINLNLGAGFGLPDWLFVYGAAIGELTFGALLCSGYLPRPVIIGLWVPSNLTLPFLGWIELAGHLPIYAVLLVLLLVGSGDATAARDSAHDLAVEAGVLSEEPAT